MNTSTLQFNYHAAKLLSGACGALVATVSDEIPAKFIPIMSSVVKFYLGADQHAIWSYEATADDHMFLRVALMTLGAQLLINSPDDDERTKMLDDCGKLDEHIKACADKMQNRALN